MGNIVDNTIKTGFTYKDTLAGSTSVAYGFLNEIEYATWAGNIEVKVSIFRPDVGVTDVGSMHIGGSFVISAGGFTEQNFETRRISPNISADFDVSFGVSNTDSKTLGVTLHNYNVNSASYVCDVKLTIAYGFVALQKPVAYV